MQKYTGHQIVYFDREGRENLPHVIRVIKKAVSKREDLRALKLIIFTAMGEGPLLAFNKLAKYDTQIIAVTFPLGFSVKSKDGALFSPRIAPKLKALFDGVGITVLIPPTMPFDPIDSMGSRNEQMRLIRDSISVFGGSFNLCIQAVMLACDFGKIEPGERVISMTGDCAAVLRAARTQKFLTPESGIAVEEILCKPRYLTIARRRPVVEKLSPRDEPPTIEATVEQAKLPVPKKE